MLDRYDDRRDDRDRRFDRRANRDEDSERRRRGRSASPPADKEPAAAEEPPVKKKKEELDPILTRTGGAYIPPAKLRMMQQQITDKSRGLLARSVLQAQAASPIFTHVYAAVVAIINSKFPQIGELILKRLILNFRRSYRRNLKAHEVLCLEMLTLLLERPTDDSVEVAISFLKECGLKLTEVSPRGINAIFERLRNILHESSIDKRVQYMIEVMFAIRKDGFKDHPVIPDGLDLVDEDDQFTHMLPLEDEYNTEDVLTKTPAVLRSDSPHEHSGINAAHTSEVRADGLRFCLLKKEYMESFEAIFFEQYDTIHRLETNKLRNVARLFAHLLYTDSVPWSVLECIRMSEETTTSSSRIFVKILFQELCAYMGLPKLNQRLKDPTLQAFFEGLFPRDNPRNTRFAINFFTSIGLGGLT
ncbi:pre-mRNA-splicing factor cwc22 [Goodea atripinnis]|uniref:Pre-mRNA-splicing factor CWC22 homolog n=1 Tax=Goodea atripinnis TaxID=208336 RepID=A0ABV0MSC4_9TELE